MMTLRMVCNTHPMVVLLWCSFGLADEAHDSIHSGLHWLGLPLNAQFWGRNAAATYLVW